MHKSKDVGLFSISIHICVELKFHTALWLFRFGPFMNERGLEFRLDTELQTLSNVSRKPQVDESEKDKYSPSNELRRGY